MRTIWKLFVGDMRRITSNVVSVLIVIGLVVIPGLFTWFNVAASWDPFANTKNLKFAVASVDEGYTSNLIPVKVTVGDQVINSLRANTQLDWTFTNKQDAIDGTQSGKYYAAVVIGKDFSKDMMTFFSPNVHHAKLTYYTNEKTNALAPKVTGQGADQVAAQINQMFAETITGTALSIASQLSKQLDNPAAKQQLAAFNANIADFASQLSQTAGMLRTYGSLNTVAQSLLSSSNELLGNASANAKDAGSELKQSQQGVNSVTSALTTTVSTLNTALNSSISSYTAVGNNIDNVFSDADSSASDISAAIRSRATMITNQINEYQEIYDSLKAIEADHPSATLQQLLDNLQTAISQQTAMRDALNESADQVDHNRSQTQNNRQEIKNLASQAADSLSSLKSDFATTLKPQIDQITQNITNSVSLLNTGSDTLSDSLAHLSQSANSAGDELTNVHDALTSVSSVLTNASNKLTDFNTHFNDALHSDDMNTIRDLLGQNPQTLAALLSAPVQIQRHAIFPVENFGTALTPFYTFIPLWVGSLLMAVTLKTSVSRKIREELQKAKPHQLYFGHFGVFAVISLLQSTFSCAGSLLFMDVHAVHPLLFMLSGWISGLVYIFFIYTLVVSFGNVGKAIGVIYLVVQISGSGGAYPLQVLPGFIAKISPFLPATHSIQAMRAAIAGIYMNDFYYSMGALLLFIPPILLLGLLLRKPLVSFNRWYIAKVESTKLI